MARFSPSAGIAIGPILFVMALLGVLAAAMSTSIGNFGTAGIADRVTADVVSQANLIRSKISECNLRYTIDTSYANNDGYPPVADTTNGDLVSDLICKGDVAGAGSNLWTGSYPLQYPPPTSGLQPWRYMNAGASGGRCFWTLPTSGAGSSGITAGLSTATRKFSSLEVSYAASSNKFVVFITRPSGAVDAHCAVP